MLTKKISFMSIVLSLIFIPLFPGCDRTEDSSPTAPEEITGNASLTKTTLPASPSNTPDIIVNATSDVADFVYRCGSYYDPATERGIAWNSPELAIPWPTESPILSARDQENPTFSEYPGPWFS